MSRNHARLAAALVCAFALTATMPAGAMAVGRALDGELLMYSNSQGFAPEPPLPTGVGTMDLSTTCDDSGSGVFTYTASGNANGPLAGTFAVTGSGSFADGVLQSLDVAFSISSGSNSAQGSLALDPMAGDLFGECWVRLFDITDDEIDDVVTFVSVGGYVDYSADVDQGSGSLPEAGKALWQISCFTVNADPPCALSGTAKIAFIGGSVPRQASGAGAASTAATATATDPIATTVAAPAGAQVEISESDAVWSWDDRGFQLLGREVSIGVYDENFEDIVTSPDDPIILTFVIYEGLLQELGVDPADVTVLRDEEPAGSCTTPGTADPDPCIESRSLVGDQLTLTVLTTHASEWSLVAGPIVTSDYEIDGFFAPLANWNVVKAGQSVPLRWRVLSGGEPVLDVDSVTVTTENFSCGRSVTPDEGGSAAGGSGLNNLGNGYYQFNWKTPKGYAGSCKTMTLTVDVGGSTVEQTAILEFAR